MVSRRPTSNSAADSRRVSPGSSANSSPASRARRHIETTSCSPCRTIVASVKPRPEVGKGLRFTFVTVANSAATVRGPTRFLAERLGNGDGCKGCTVAGRAKTHQVRRNRLHGRWRPSNSTSVKNGANLPARPRQAARGARALLLLDMEEIGNLSAPSIHLF